MSGQSHDAVQLLRPLADRPDATQQTRHDLAAVLTMDGDRTAATAILSKDLPPDQVREALNAFASARCHSPSTRSSCPCGTAKATTREYSLQCSHCARVCAMK